MSNKTAILILIGIVLLSNIGKAPPACQEFRQCRASGMSCEKLEEICAEQLGR